MALQIWLPLNGNLNNQGLNNTTFTGSTTFEPGKLGQAGVFGTAAKRAISSATVTLNSQVTIAFWIKIKTWVNWGRIFNLYNSNKTNTISCVSNTSTDKRIGTQVNKNGTNLTDSYNGSFDLNTWYHFAMVVNGTTKQHYINGSLVGTATLSDSMVTTNYTVMCGGTADSGTPVDMDINDFRVYDNALSPKEIEILSRGLVCHYPLNGGGRGQDNLFRDSFFQSDMILTASSDMSSPLGFYNGTASNHSLLNGEDTILLNSQSNIGINFKRVATDISLDSTSYYTISCEAKCTNASAHLDIGLSYCNTSDTWIWRGGTNANYFTAADTWQKFTLTFKPDADTKYIGYCFTCNCGGNHTLTLRHCKLEKGSVATPWMPNSTDTAYTTMGYDSTTEYDVSGYQNNMTKTGTITYTSDSARYSVSSHFINGSYLIANQNCGEYLPTDGLTVNLWIKATTWGTPISCTEGGGWNIESYNNGLQFQCMITSVGYKPAWCNVTAASITDNKWHMLTGTFDRAAQQTKIYIDGVLKGTGNTGSTYGISYVANRLIISGEAQSTTPASSYFVGEESDVRIYATALSAAQVAELYNTAVSVANNGALMGYELVEV